MAIHIQAQIEIMKDEKRKQEMVDYWNKRFSERSRFGKALEVIAVDSLSVQFQCENGQTWCGWF